MRAPSVVSEQQLKDVHIELIKQIKGVKKLNENKESRIEKTGFWVHFGGGYELIHHRLTQISTEFYFSDFN